MIITQCVKTNGKQMREPMSLNDWIMDVTLLNEGNVLNIFFSEIYYIFFFSNFSCFLNKKIEKVKTNTKL